jgi:hypothetical protein
MILMPGLPVGWTILTDIGAAAALDDIASRPVTALTRDDGALRIAVRQPGRMALPGEARGLGGSGIIFGYRMGYILPDGSAVDCAVRFRQVNCSDGWTAERAG